MDSQVIRLDEKGGVATLTLNRPDRDNAVNSEVMDALAETLAGVGDRALSKVLVLQGSGDHFCGGREPEPTPPKGPKEWNEVLNKITRVNRLLASFPGITISLVHGKAFGFGLGLAVGCDITLAAENARLAFPEVKGGLPPTIVMSYLGRLIPRKKAFELVITGREMDPHEGERLGLVNRVVPADQLVAEGERWVSLFLKLNEETLKTCKAYFRETANLSSEDAVRYGVTLLANFMSDKPKQ
jgi:enoyl-CoA hydratase/carnithine racemase